jgi:nicotinamide-nucleotide amidase
MADDLHPLVLRLSAALRAAGKMLATAESCTGGLIAACLTDLAGSSEIFDRGFVTYSNEAKQDMLGVAAETLAEFGAVSEQTAVEMAQGALDNSAAEIAAAVTGIAGPGGGTVQKPVGLVHIAAGRGSALRAEEHRFGDPGREQVRLRTVEAALHLLTDFLSP